VSEELRASDTEREQAVTRLRDASAEGRLTLEELAERTALAYQARTHGELARVTDDLPAAVAQPAKAPRSFGLLVTLFAPIARRKRRPLPRHTLVVSIFGPVRLDLRATTKVPDDAAIWTISLFGPLFVTVPEHVDVDTTVLALFAPVREADTSDLSPGAPRLRIRGASLFAPVFVNVARS
jgi:hypothetical protein